MLFMKNKFIIIVLLNSILVFSQKKITKKLQTTAKEIEVSTLGLDNILIENSTSNFVEVFLFDENPNKHHITILEKNNWINSCDILSHSHSEKKN